MSIESKALAGSAGRVERCARRAAALFGIVTVTATVTALAALTARPAAAEDARPPAESAASRPVTLGEVATSAAAGSTRLLNVADLLRSDAEAELAAIDWTHAKLRHRYTVSALIVRLDSAPLGERARSPRRAPSRRPSATSADRCWRSSRAAPGPRTPRPRGSPPSETRSRAPCAARSPPSPRRSAACSERSPASALANAQRSGRVSARRSPSGRAPARLPARGSGGSRRGSAGSPLLPA